MTASRKRHLTEKETAKAMNNSQFDLSSEDELLTACSSEPDIQDTIPLAGKTLLDYFQLFFDENMIQYIVDETNRYYS